MKKLKSVKVEKPYELDSKIVLRSGDDFYSGIVKKCRKLLPFLGEPQGYVLSVKVRKLKRKVKNA